jgi:hypothetical protein
VHHARATVVSNVVITEDLEGVMVVSKVREQGLVLSPHLAAAAAAAAPSGSAVPGSAQLLVVFSTSNSIAAAAAAAAVLLLLPGLLPCLVVQTLLNSVSLWLLLHLIQLVQGLGLTADTSYDRGPCPPADSWLTQG